VTTVTPGGPAESAGVNAGDVITELDGQAVSGPDDVSRIVNTKQPGDHLHIRVDRSGQDVTVDATLQNRPAHTP
jgi:putative serine protease PepD